MLLDAVVVFDALGRDRRFIRNPMPSKAKLLDKLSHRERVAKDSLQLTANGRMLLRRHERFRAAPAFV